MTVSVVSDLHCHGGSLPKRLEVDEMTPADVLVVAGDIATGDTYAMYRDKLLKAVAGKFGKVIIVKGNHDFYTETFLRGENDAPGPCIEDNFVESVDETVEGKTRTVDFICTPMWTPIRNSDKVSISLNDYNYIPNFTTGVSTELFYFNLDWLEGKVKEARGQGHDVVIVTHHLPRHELIDPIYEGDPINEAFCVIDEYAENRLNALRPLAWIHGHSHNFIDVTIDGVRYVRNPIGYDYSFRTENTGYVNNFTIKI